MNATADGYIRMCEAAIQSGHLDIAKKLAQGVGILTGQPAWKSAYDFIIDRKSADDAVRVSSVSIPASWKAMLNELHDTEGREFKNQSAKGGTQVDLTSHPEIRQWIEDHCEGEIAGAWTTRLQKGGYHTNHIHPRGGESHVVYVDIPDSDTGLLQFGVTRYSDRAPSKVVSPKAGMMVSFPCWMWHGVTRYEGDEPRLTVAFDVVRDA